MTAHPSFAKPPRDPSSPPSCTHGDGAPASHRPALSRAVLRAVAQQHLALMDSGLGFAVAHRRVVECRSFGWWYSTATIRREIDRLRLESDDSRTITLEQSSDGAWRMPSRAPSHEEECPTAPVGGAR